LDLIKSGPVFDQLTKDSAMFLNSFQVISPIFSWNYMSAGDCVRTKYFGHLAQFPFLCGDEGY